MYATGQIKIYSRLKSHSCSAGVFHGRAQKKKWQPKIEGLFSARTKKKD